MARIKQEGFPSYKSVGKKRIADILLLIIHGIRRHDEARVYFFNLLKQEINKGNISPHEYANIIDMYEVKTLKQASIYAVFLNKSSPKSIKDLAELDDRRLQLGLVPYYLYTQKMYWKLPQDYIQKDFSSYLKSNCHCSL